LSTVQNIVRQSAGAVWVSSEIGQGSTFTVCLPRADASPGTASAPRPAKPHSGTETILLVEDDPGVCQLLSRILRDRGYTVIEACHSEQALELFEKHSTEIHLVLTDVVMPGKSGLELADILRAKRPDLKILCMSGYTEDVLVNSGSFSPGTPFLRKPLRPDTLAAGVRETLDSPSLLPFNPR
jgi:CheY-like chemotaxis protein